MTRRLARAFLARPSWTVAPDLLGAVLWHDGVAGQIVEAEAYGGANDPASHAFRGERPRNAVMFGPAGHLYMYFTYGMHFCANVVTGREGEASAVLVRALAPIAGIDEMWARRPRAKRDTDLCSGPAKLCQALAIDRTHDGVDVATGAGGIELRTGSAPAAVVQTTRVGITAATEVPWRWYVAGDPHVSRPR